MPGGGSTLTDASGAYTLPGLFAGDYQIIASKDQWSVGVENVSLTSGQDLTDCNFLLTPVFSVQDCETPGLSIPDDNATGVKDTCTVVSAGEISAVEVFLW